MKKQITYSKDKLIELIKGNTISVPILLSAFRENIINARTLLDVLHECVECDKEDFIKYVNGYTAVQRNIR